MIAVKNIKEHGARLSSFQKKINYHFMNHQLLNEALTHTSYANESGLPFNNQRLEFLGDAVLELVVSEKLYKENHAFSEGALTRARSRLVRKSSLCKWAEHVGLSGLLFHGKSIGGGGVTSSMAADAVEAVFGAVFLDGGYERVFAVIAAYLDFVSSYAGDSELDPKTKLQELLQAEGVGVPYYKQIDKKGPDHALHFKVDVTLGDALLGMAWGPSVKDAEFEAARAALDFLKKNPDVVKKLVS